MLAENAASKINVDTKSFEFIDKLQQLDLNTILNKYIIPYGMNIVIAIAIFVFGKMVARIFSKLLGKAVLRSTKDEMLQGFVISISYFLLLLIVVIATLSQLGINTSSLVALIGAAGLAVSLALQNSLQNFAAGVMILIFKPFHKGDFIETSGVSGKVQQIGLLVLEVRTGDNKSVLVPNSKVFSNNITNYSANDTRRIDLTFYIAYEADIKKAKGVIESILESDNRILPEPKPTVVMGSLTDSNIQILVRPWVKTSDYWTVYFETMEKVKLSFDNAGIVFSTTN